MKIGVVLGFEKELAQKFTWCCDRGITTCQLHISPECFSDEVAEEIISTCKSTGMEITALVGMWSGPAEWNFKNGPSTLGIVPVAFRFGRIKELIEYAKFANKLNVTDVCSHMGFIPENYTDSLYTDFIASAKYLAQNYKSLGINLNFETGQETPTTLARAIEDIGYDNIGINYDPANLLMYGKANPIDALEILGKYIKGVHAKDGLYPTNGYELGEETALGQGKVNFKEFLPLLLKHGYTGAITIEREISGEQQQQDVILARDLINDILK